VASPVKAPVKAGSGNQKAENNNAQCPWLATPVTGAAFPRSGRRDFSGLAQTSAWGLGRDRYPGAEADRS